MSESLPIQSECNAHGSLNHHFSIKTANCNEDLISQKGKMQKNCSQKKKINVVVTLAKDSNLSELGDFSFLEFQTKVICTFPRKGNMLYNFNKNGSTII